ncbi:Helix-turn-helix domain-containing protein [Bradyrhizobium sp. Ghvi]|uniref:helix-turn-helix transcriptional regulator n=1 Tax=Bradyrhizobium sp. Ghvi TaxID=1855319 RepID=UPI0008F04732|nr:helix-turn-helix domain-containing protein [Bradyrhizobium sp. Ghvi]SFO25650.1 Helix-turn-helix domain-containing protein [Bradyrhizobium sp. Ghvi]
MHQIDQGPGQNDARRTRGRPKGSTSKRRESAPEASTPAPSGYHKPEAAAARIGLTPGTLAKWRCAGTGPAYIRIGGRILYKEADLDAFRDACRVIPGGSS